MSRSRRPSGENRKWVETCRGAGEITLRWDSLPCKWQPVALLGAIYRPKVKRDAAPGINLANVRRRTKESAALFQRSLENFHPDAAERRKSARIHYHFKINIFTFANQFISLTIEFCSLGSRGLRCGVVGGPLEQRHRNLCTLFAAARRRAAESDRGEQDAAHSLFQSQTVQSTQSAPAPFD